MEGGFLCPTRSTRGRGDRGHHLTVKLGAYAAAFPARLELRRTGRLGSGQPWRRRQLEAHEGPSADRILGTPPVYSPASRRRGRGGAFSLLARPPPAVPRSP